VGAFIEYFLGVSLKMSGELSLNTPLGTSLKMGGSFHWMLPQNTPRYGKKILQKSSTRELSLDAP